MSERELRADAYQLKLIGRCRWSLLVPSFHAGGRGRPNFRADRFAILVQHRGGCCLEFDEDSSTGFESPLLALQFLALIERYGVPRETHAYTEIWVAVSSGDFEDAEREAWAWCHSWSEYVAGRRTDWMPQPDDYDQGF